MGASNTKRARGSDDGEGEPDEGQLAGTAEIIVEELNMPNQAVARMVHNVYTSEECQALIAHAEERGFETALLNIGAGMQVEAKDTRSSLRCIIDDEDAAAELFRRISDHVPATWNIPSPRGASGASGWETAGCNERLRFLKYRPGDFFAAHMDGAFVRDASFGDREGEKSAVTVQLYLNNGGGKDFNGGETTFFVRENRSLNMKRIPVVPRAGSVLLFEHRLYHEGSLLLDAPAGTEGLKYAIRTDVMYREP